MPVEIKELHIKAVVSEKNNQQNSTANLSMEDLNRLKKEIAKDVTDKVLRILRQKNER